MCKHIPNAQVSIRAPCCHRWFDCAECHAEVADHPLERSTEMVMACKKCRKVFRLRLEDFEADADGHCPRCDNRFFTEAEDAAPTGPALQAEIDDVRELGSNNMVIVDERDGARERLRLQLREQMLREGYIPDFLKAEHEMASLQPGDYEEI